MKIPAHAKYQIIYDTLQKNDNLLNVAAMCEIAEVSRSGYYHYLSTEDRKRKIASTLTFLGGCFAATDI